MPELLHAWWRQPDHYDWLAGYLQAQRLRDVTRLVMALMGIALMVATVAMLHSPREPAAGLPRTIGEVSIVASVIWTVLWSLRWPTRRQSQAASIICAIITATCCLLASDPMVGVANCAVLGVLGCYVGMAHGARLFAAILGVGVVTCLLAATRLAVRGDPAAAVGEGLIGLVGVAVAPCVTRTLTQLLGSDAAKSEMDALTGLLNRRGFYRRAHDLVVRADAQGHPSISAALIDIDRFKAINDTRGHAAGDELLAAIANILKAIVGDKTDNVIAGRYGGEEFVIAATMDAHALESLSERVRRDIAALPNDVTASVGTATATLFAIDDHRIRYRLDDLIDAADRAMYDAKRAGGDQVRHVAAADIEQTPGSNATQSYPPVSPT
ncbi:diguanylate cyclase domain-containing protein [Mycobacterium sp. MAA66]|uniref:GGDEF domain-containing protein n=1 Tax=Mycobacterium sp. MAA66 TaxID=3156297 RepID=UPI003515D78E